MSISGNPKAVVFGYHNVGVRCLQVLLARGLEVALVITHGDNANETIWFDSMERCARDLGIPVEIPHDVTSPEWVDRVRAVDPDFIFSFYYRKMLPMPLLANARYGAFNMHGSLLPKYRGRAPVNWAVLHGECETGATLHEMSQKPDAGAIVAQTAVPILPHDTARHVFDKVVVAAEITLWRVLPDLISGTARRRQNDLTQGSYFGGRTSEDGRIDWAAPASQVYNLIRAVAPPYPGATFEQKGRRFIVGAARPVLDDNDHAVAALGPFVSGGRVLAHCGDGGLLELRGLTWEQFAVTADEFAAFLKLPT